MAKECADIEDAYLYTLDDLSKIADENAAARRSEIESAAKIAREKALYTSEKLFPENNSDAAQLAGGIAFNNLLVKFDTNTKNHH
jgi:glutamyl-tRNA reductase